MNPSELVNKKAPKICGVDFNSNEFSVVYFYPKDNTPGCTLEAKDFSDFLPEFKKLKTEIYGISKDSHESHCNFIEKQGLKINLISDEEKNIQKKYGVWQLKKFMGKEFLGTLRTTFLIDKNGNVVNVWENVRAKGHAKKILEYVGKEFSK